MLSDTFSSSVCNTYFQVLITPTGHIEEVSVVHTTSTSETFKRPEVDQEVTKILR